MKIGVQLASARACSSMRGLVYSGPVRGMLCYERMVNNTKGIQMRQRYPSDRCDH